MQPDRTMSDFYCKICDSHMNSEQMWESHVSGKRHLKNVKKEPGEMPSKVKSLKVFESPKLMEVVKNVHEPLVGLGFMTELQRADPCLNPSYTCHLCQANLTWSVVIDHILGTKHRLAYMKAVDPEEYNVINNIELKKTSLDKLVEDRARNYEYKRGCGTMEVKIEKPKVAPPPPKREKVDDAVPARSSTVYYSEDRAEKKIVPTEYDSNRRRERSRSPQHRYPSSSSYKSKKYSSPDRWRHDLYSPERRSPSPRPPYPAFSSGVPDIENMSMADRMNVLRALSRDIILVSKDEVRKVKAVITFLSKGLLQYKINHLPPEVQNKLAHFLVRGKIRSFVRELRPCLSQIFDGVSALTSHHRRSSSSKKHSH